MAAVKAVLAKEVDRNMYYIFPRTSADMVEYKEEITLKDELDRLQADIDRANATATQALATATAVQTEVTNARVAASDGNAKANLKERIDADYKTVHDELVAARTAKSDGKAKSTLKERLDTDYSALKKNIDDNKTASDNADTKLRQDFTAADTQLRKDFTAADTAIQSDLDEKYEELTGTDTAIQADLNKKYKELKDADTTITNNYTAADTKLRQDFTAADTTITNNYTAADTKIKEDMKAADDALQKALDDYKKATDATIGDLSSKSNSHVHGNITNDGKIASAVAHAAADGFVMIDASDGNKIIRSDITLGTSTTTYLRNDGAWATPYTHPASALKAGSYGPDKDVVGNNGNEIVVPQITTDANGHVTGVTNRVYTSVDHTYTALKNPNALKFTGVSTASYDGSAVVTVDIPVKPATAGTADKVAHKLTFSGVSSQTYDGSAAITVNIPAKPATAGTADKVANALTFSGASTQTYDGSKAVTVNIPSKPTTSGTADKVSHALTFSGASTQTYDGSTAVTVNIPTKPGTAGTADKVANALTFNGTNPQSYNGSAAVNVTATAPITLTGAAFSLATSGVTAGTYGPTADVTGTNDAKIKVPQITVDKFGRVTGVKEFTLTSKDSDTKYSNFTKATADAAGKAGLVPAPGKGAQSYYLRGDATWVAPSWLPLAGGTMTGSITFNETAGNNAIKYKTSTRTGTPIKFYAGDANGSGVVIGDGGMVVIGAGESSTSLHTALIDEDGKANGTEELFLSADSNVYIYTNCNTIANRKTITFDTSGGITAPGGFKGTATNANHLISAAIAANTDLNTLTTPGFYHCSSNANAKTCPNSPTTNAFTMIVTQSAGVSQLAIEYMTGARKMFHRNKYSSDWGEWCRIYTTIDKPPDTNTTYSNFTAATADAAGKAGLVPAPGAGKQTYFLRGDATWAVPTNTNAYHKSGSWSGLTYTATAVGGAAELKFTVPTMGAATASVAGTAGAVPASKAGDQSKFLRADGTWAVPTNTTYSNFTAATADAAGKAGLVPAPSKGYQSYYLRGDAKWAAFPNVTTSANGFMLAADKSKLDYTNIAYCTCSTAAATVEKAITVSGNSKWTMSVGAIIVVKFSETNTAQNPTFNVASKGAKKVWYNTAVLTTGSLGYAGTKNRPMIYMYDGTNWVFLGWSYDTNTTYSNASLGQGYGTCTTAAATVEKVVTLSSYALTTGGVVSVKFTYDVPAKATMNINSKGAKAIYYKGAAITAGVIKAGDIATFIYSSQYHLISIDNVRATTASSADKVNHKLKFNVYSPGGAASVVEYDGSADTTVSVNSYSSGTGISITTNTISLATTGVTANTYGSATAIPQLTIDAYGRITKATTVAISGGATYTAGTGISIDSSNKISLASVSGAGYYGGDITFGKEGTALRIYKDGYGRITAATDEYTRKIRMEVLWKNAQPRSEMAHQRIAIGKSLFQYGAFLVLPESDAYIGAIQFNNFALQYRFDSKSSPEIYSPMGQHLVYIGYSAGNDLRLSYAIRQVSILYYSTAYDFGVDIGDAYQFTMYSNGINNVQAQPVLCYNMTNGTNHTTIMNNKLIPYQVIGIIF